MMVREKRVKGQIVYVCEICGLGYADRETANECEEWCRKTGTCSIKVTQKAVYVPNPFENKSESSCRRVLRWKWIMRPQNRRFESKLYVCVRTV